MKLSDYIKKESIGLWLGLISFFFLMLFPVTENQITSCMVAVTSLMVIWWISEAIPLGATSLVPLVAFPLLGIIAGDKIAREYFNSTILIFLGGFLLALAMQRWMLHKRISLIIIKLLGTGPSGIIFGFMVSAAFLSMFISNVATTVMLLPIGLAFIKELEEEHTQQKVHHLAVSIMLGIAYSSSIGGIATLIGTAPNLIFQRVYEMNFPELQKITFASWLGFGFPISVIMLISVWILFTRILFKNNEEITINRALIKEQLSRMGKISFEEKIVLVVFFTTMLLWLFRVNINLGVFVVPGWSEFLPSGSLIDDGTVAIFSGLLLFILPSKNERNEKILNIEVLSKIPWEVILIFGGGFALAKGFTESGLSELIGHYFHNINGLSDATLTVLVCTMLTFLTELTSNTATTNTILPILASLAKSNSINPLLIMLPATISASFAFMLPVGTPPNAIVYGSGKIKLKEMIKAGILINIWGIIIVSLYCLIFI